MNEPSLVRTTAVRRERSPEGVARLLLHRRTATQEHNQHDIHCASHQAEHSATQTPTGLALAIRAAVEEVSLRPGR